MYAKSEAAAGEEIDDVPESELAAVRRQLEPDGALDVVEHPLVGAGSQATVDAIVRNLDSGGFAPESVRVEEAAGGVGVCVVARAVTA